MTRREVLTLLVLLAAAIPRRLDARGQQKPKPSKPATVTLTIEGMT